MKEEKYEIHDCLIELGFNEEEIINYFEYSKTKNKNELLRLLNKKRKQILSEVHSFYKKLECIDYLINENEKKE